MSTLTLVIVITFVLGYLGIALESSLKVNKAALALLMCSKNILAKRAKRSFS